MCAIFKRVSVRKYLDKTVEQEKIEQVLKAAMQAPSAKNQQAWRFIVVRNKQIKDALAKVTPYGTPVINAPMVIVVANDTKNSTMPIYVDIDASIASENIMLEARNQELGTCMIGIAPTKEYIEECKKILNTELDVFTLIAIGYPEYQKEVKLRFDENKIINID